MGDGSIVRPHHLVTFARQSGGVEAREYGSRAAIAIIIRAFPLHHSSSGSRSSSSSSESDSDVTTVNSTMRSSRMEHLMCIEKWAEREKESDLQCLFIVRSQREGDRWSGDVAFPGGRQETGEIDFETAVREVREEIGVDLHHPAYAFAGRLRDHAVFPTSQKSLVVCSFVFIQLCPAFQAPNLVLDPKEVAAARWVSLSLFSSFPYLSPLLTTRDWVIPVISGLSPLRVPYTAVRLPPESSFSSSSSLDSCSSSPPCASSFQEQDIVLWGLTLSFTSNFMHALTGYAASFVTKAEVYYRASSCCCCFFHGARKRRTSQIF